MHFGEYELFPNLIGLSPLSTVHPKTFQRLAVRASMGFYPHFTLTMDSSLGFASAPLYCSPVSDSLSLRLHPLGA